MTEIIHTTEQVSGIKTYASMPDIPKEFIVGGVKYKVTIEKEAGRISEGATVVLSFPKEKCIDVDFKGIPFVQIDTGMTIEGLIEMFSKHAISGHSVGVVVKRRAKE